MFVYSLTDLTGRRKNADRTMVVATVEVNRFTFLVVLMSLVPAIPLTAVVALLLGPFVYYAAAVPLLCVFAGLAFVDTKTKKGLQLRRYEAMWDKRKAKDSATTVYVCSEPLKRTELVTLIQTVVPNRHYVASDGDTDLFDIVAGRKTSAAGIGASTKSSARADRSFLE